MCFRDMLKTGIKRLSARSINLPRRSSWSSIGWSFSSMESSFTKALEQELFHISLASDSNVLISATPQIISCRSCTPNQPKTEKTTRYISITSTKHSRQVLKSKCHSTGRNSSSINPPKHRSWSNYLHYASGISTISREIHCWWSLDSCKLSY